MRGATVSYVTCDGVFSDCDLFQEATGAKHGRQENSCLVCQSSVAARLASWNMPYCWLGTWLTTQDRTDAGRWIAELNPDQYVQAQLNGWDIGAWVQSSVRTELRCTTFDMTDEKTASVYASYLYSGALAALGLNRLFEDEKPATQLLFNGRMAPTRIALELAKSHGIRTICEERAAVVGHMILFDNENCLDVSHVDAMWEHWKNTPLTPDEVSTLATVLENRRTKTGDEVSIFSTARQNHKNLCTALSLDETKTIWTLFTSSEDEIADKADIDGIFENQRAWIESTIQYASTHQDIQLVIRVHPNVGGHSALGQNTEELAYFEALSRAVPSNIRIVQPGDLTSSYSLAEICDLALVWYSTIAIETAALGRRVVRAGGFLLENRDFIYAPDSPSEYPTLLDQMQTTPSEQEVSRIAISAWRFAYIWYLRRAIPFPLVAQPEWYKGELAWDDVNALAPGCEENLDRICDIVLNGTEIHWPPTPRDSKAQEQERHLIQKQIVPFEKSEPSA